MQLKQKEARRLKIGFKDVLYLALFALVFSGVFNKANESVKEVKPVQMVQATTASLAFNPEPIVVETERVVKVEDDRARKLQKALEEENSPLAPYADLIVSEADKYDIGWTTLASIACMESACGNKLPAGSHNAWGLGGSKFMYFKSWDDSIKYASHLLGTQYKTKQFEGIKAKYCPASDGCNPNWANIVVNKTNEILALKENK